MITSSQANVQQIVHICNTAVQLGCRYEKDVLTILLSSYMLSLESERWPMIEEKDIHEYNEELLRIVEEFRQKIIAGTSEVDHFLSISEIERLWSELRGSTSLIYSDMLSDLLSVTNESELIRKKKQNISKKE
jgi:hypothetical protein